MANNTGTADFTSGTGVKTFSIGMTPTWMQLFIHASGCKPTQGFIYGGNQYSLSDETSNPVAKALQVKDTSGTIVFEGTWTSFASSQVNFNVTTNTLGTPRILMVFGN